MAVGADGTIYIADFERRRVVVRPPTGETLLVGSGAEGIGDGAPSEASFMGPAGIAVDAAGVVYVADSPAHRIRRIDSTGHVSTLAGGGQVGLGGGRYLDGQGASARFSLPAGLAIAPDGSVLVADKDNHRIRRIDAAGNVSMLAGSGVEGISDGRALSASFAFPVGLDVDSAGAIYVSQHGQLAIRRISPDGVVTTLLAAPARSGISGLAVGPDGTVFAADFAASRIIAISPTGSVIGEIGTTPGFQDGPAASARLAAPTDVAVTPAGTLVIADAGNQAIREAKLEDR